MKKIEEVLSEEKRRIAEMTPPPDFEARMRSALDAKPTRKSKRKNPYIMMSAVGVLCFMLISYNYNAFAFYGKKIFGYEEIITGTMKDLNEKGMGQIIERKTTLIDGTELIIDGIMTDANQLVMYYTLSNPQGIADSLDYVFISDKITGFLTNAHGGGSMELLNDEGTEIKGTMYFDPVSPFAKKLTLHFWQGQEYQEGSITFPYDPNKAMQTQIKQSIKETVKVDKGTVTFKTITATPTSTVIEGKMDVDNFDRIRFGFEGVKLIANGNTIDNVGYGVRSAFNGSKFDLRFDGLPEELHSLELVVNEFVGYQKLEEQILVAENTQHDLDGNDLWIKKVAATERGIEITIETDENLLLDGVSIQNGDKVTPIKTTIGQRLNKKTDRITSERTMVFETKSMPEYLLIKGIHYVKEYNQKIEIPVD
ncbi:DUF4179 domain-containing protein [Mesobacillus selenatarsenatis]|uniref:DUF4179 domain-containing protein n=1 Tax=Mesobacillus selenatarsenatis TaxID=388741 RepID=A0A846TG06_9BACI|nr:DUF4179 domain-containing protein [Mesobacillus selenatarsenatis]NKE05850.1 DUF4179 domain-containing protein [Mesobacillus selenatarsenatis]